MSRTKGIGGHQSAASATCRWITPPSLVRMLGPFDLDPCADTCQPWYHAPLNYTVKDDGLSKPWKGRVWMNPPYDTVGQWMGRLWQHGNGIALIFARTERADFFKYVWRGADSVLFIEGRLYFYTPEGVRGKANAGAPSCLVAYGESNVTALQSSGIPGEHKYLNCVPLVIVGVSPSWKSVITIAIGRLNGEAHVQAIYHVVTLIAPDKVAGNPNFKAKIRERLQKYFTRINKGVYGNKN